MAVGVRRQAVHQTLRVRHVQEHPPPFHGRTYGHELVLELHQGVRDAMALQLAFQVGAEPGGQEHVQTGVSLVGLILVRDACPAGGLGQPKAAEYRREARLGVGRRRVHVRGGQGFQGDAHTTLVVLSAVAEVGEDLGVPYARRDGLQRGHAVAVQDQEVIGGVVDHQLRAPGDHGPGQVDEGPAPLERDDERHVPRAVLDRSELVSGVERVQSAGLRVESEGTWLVRTQPLPCLPSVVRCLQGVDGRHVPGEGVAVGLHVAGSVTVRRPPAPRSVTCERGPSRPGRPPTPHA